MQAHLLRSQKLESLSVLAGGIAHDFNNLLMGIIANVSLMMDDLPPDSPLQVNGESVLAATEQAAHLTRQMLAYSGRGDFAVQPVGLAAQVKEISSLDEIFDQERPLACGSTSIRPSPASTPTPARSSKW